MMSPALFLLAAISFIPLFMMIWMSLSKVGLIGGLSFSFIGLENWRHLFGDPQIGSSWILSIIYFAATVGIELVLGTAMALLIHSMIRARNLVLSLVLIPMFIAPVIVGLLGRFLLNSGFGLYTWVLSVLGLYDGNILGSVGPALVAVIGMNVWEWSPLIALIVLAGLTAVPNDILEAAEVDGASYWRKLVSIVVPSILPILLVALLIRSMDAIRFFAIILITTNGGPADSTKIIPIRLYDIAFRFFNLGYAAAVGLTMLVFSIIIANIFVQVFKRRQATL
ncbi:sugar ABC transporter permease [Salinisphaera sp.]|uniref:carbohydrate ABC transporter permease n=1 Tax=Salinisphaera sp. TaxID=1914330 RepID=UPI002D786457|nr:sugar ABC transporter permease [Salinisphaera sp.]HET7314789.1 sugar ABC transporter permease [Salinisphaera sp.]